MRRHLLFLICLVAALSSTKAAIDLAPTLMEYKNNGITFKQLVFKDGTTRITYELPSQWSHRSSGDSLKLVPPGGSTADVAILAVPLAMPQPLDEKGIAAARQHFTQGIPPAVQSVKVLGEESNTVPFKGANWEITASYQALGEVFVRRALYINLPDTQLIFRVTARKSEFDALWQTFRASILSWQWEEQPETTTVAQNTAR